MTTTRRGELLTCDGCGDYIETTWGGAIRRFEVEHAACGQVAA